MTRNGQRPVRCLPALSSFHRRSHTVCATSCPTGPRIFATQRASIVSTQPARRRSISPFSSSRLSSASLASRIEEAVSSDMGGSYEERLRFTRTSPATTPRAAARPGRGGGAAAGGEIGLSEEREGEPRRERHLFRLDEILGGNASRCPVAEHEHAPWLVDVVEMGVCGAVIRSEDEGGHERIVA